MKKICKECGLEKNIDEFYIHQQMADKHLNKCKDCVKKRIHKHRENNIEKIRQYDRERGKFEYRVELNKLRNKNLSQEKRKEYQEKWKNKNKDKKSAHILLNNYIRYKKDIKPNKCSLCNIENVKIIGHHPDYTQPLNVVWVCNNCHRKLHRKYND